jgi:hypothetical protein
MGSGLLTGLKVLVTFEVGGKVQLQKCYGILFAPGLLHHALLRETREIRSTTKSKGISHFFQFASLSSAQRPAAYARWYSDPG